MRCLIYANSNERSSLATDRFDQFRERKSSMVNLYDMNGIQATAQARRERFLQEVEQDRIARMLRTQRVRPANRVRRAVGYQLIRAGAHLSGERSLLVRQSGMTT